MIPLEIALFLGGVAAILALYSFLERGSWMYSQITASALSACTLWVLTALAASGNIGAYTALPIRQEMNTTANITVTNITNEIITVPIMDTSLPLIASLFAIVMSVYFILHAAVWVQERIENKEEED